MLEKAFLKRIEDYYHTEYEDSLGSHILDWVTRYKFTAQDLDRLFWATVQESSFLPDIRKFNNSLINLIKEGAIDLGSGGTVVHHENAITAHADGLLMSVDSIIRRCEEVRSKTGDILTKDVDFMHEWDLLYYAYSHLTSIGWERPRIMAYLEAIKKPVAEGTFSYNTLPEGDADRDATKDVARVLEKQERQGKLIPFDELELLV